MSMPTTFLVLALCCPSRVLGASLPSPGGSAIQVDGLLVFLLDDERWDETWNLPLLGERLADHAITFHQAFVTTPVCAPSRASFLSGGYYPHNTGVLTITAPNGGASRFHDEDTIATRLWQAGWFTALVGKYINGYESLAPYVPPGWSYFAGFVDSLDWYDYQLVLGSSSGKSSTGKLFRPMEYVTEYQSGLALDALSQVGDEPFFLLFSTFAPHEPCSALPQDLGSYQGYEHRSGAFNEQDVSDKPRWLQVQPLLSDEDISSMDQDYSQCLDSMLAVDRAAMAVLDTLEEMGRADSTLVVLASDNGMLWGEHRLIRKGVPYDEASRVPLVIYHPGLEARDDQHLVSLDLDLAPTLMEIAGLAGASDGQSLLPLLWGESPSWRDELLLEAWTETPLPWAGLRGADWKYVEYVDGEQELYDLDEDPYEEQSLHESKKHAEIAASFAERLATTRGLAVTTTQLPQGTVAEDYLVQLQAWGGSPPYEWSIYQGELPAGLTLGVDGVISGEPLVTGSHELTYCATDSWVSPSTGDPMSHCWSAVLEILPGDSGELPTGDSGPAGTGGLDSGVAGRDSGTGPSTPGRRCSCSGSPSGPAGYVVLLFTFLLGVLRRWRVSFPKERPGGRAR